MNYISCCPDNQRIRLGDICVIHISDHCRYTLKIEGDAQLQTKFGLIKASDLIGHRYGLRFDCKKGWVLPLRLTPELWTQLLPHRTQILYQADISLILLQLDIRPGSVVVESGTGSGSLSHAILRACLPHGFLHTFDVNEFRVNEAGKEFEAHGFGSNVKVYHRNVCDSGYVEELEGLADACILDLPQTWTAIEHANKVLKPNGSRLCAFSPCIEQVQQNVAKMSELKFKDITTVECLMRPYEVKEKRLRLWNDDILAGLAAVDAKRFENIKNSLDPLSKRPKMDDEKDGESRDDTMVDRHHQLVKIKYDSTEDDNLELLNNALADPKAPFAPHMLPKSLHLYAKQFDETVSHSGFLTFASKRN